MKPLVFASAFLLGLAQQVKADSYATPGEVRSYWIGSSQGTVSILCEAIQSSSLGVKEADELASLQLSKAKYYESKYGASGVIDVYIEHFNSTLVRRGCAIKPLQK